MSVHRPNYLSLALHGALKLNRPCLASGFVMNGDDEPISPVLTAWITIAPHSVQRKRGRKEDVLKKAAVLLADLCWRGPRLKGDQANQKLCEYFGYADPRHAKRDIARAKKVLPRGFILVGAAESSAGDKFCMAVLFEGIPAAHPKETAVVAMTGPGYHWREPEKEAIFDPALTLELTVATRIDLERLTVTLADMARIHSHFG